ncbi:hypothetical protein OVA03_11820 [Asticcacaulis sp. SL142]|uniref:hypothetical protein n=1 Tax=Asticcacaulis sp. SL142 TaxID=2995155 RepID=UPI00226CE61B|nr:hypothetical protein [Asticcacaulis sp. SL142]WAC47388.1 hypothetical protein OVA03_11820 [Asticcacaulis sp. SL142]
MIKALLDVLPMSELHKSMIAAPWLIGTFVQEWSKLEYTTTSTICAFNGAEFDKQRYEFLKNTSEQPNLLFGAVISEFPTEADIVKSKYSYLCPIRHDIVHGFWNGIDDDGNLYAKRTKNKVNNTYKVKFSPPEFEQHINSVKTLNHDIWCLRLMHQKKDFEFLLPKFKPLIA